MMQITRLIKHVQKYLANDIYQLPPNARINSFILHYYNEIVRHWNTLNYIINKTLRYMGTGHVQDPSVKATLFYLSYRFYYERAKLDRLKNELEKGTIFNSDLKKLINQFIQNVNSFSMKKALQHKERKEILSIKSSIPSFTIDRLKDYLSLNRIQKEYEYMDKMGNAPFKSLRINDLNQKISNEEVIKRLTKFLNLSDKDLIFDEHLPEIIYIPKKYKTTLLESELYRQGYILFHDKASSVVIKCLKPQSGDFLLDMCAAPGIKTSLMAQKSNNEALIIANDFSFERIIQSRNLLNKLSAEQVVSLNADAISPPIREGVKFDRILVDAPCTGSGTFVSNPELKWRQNWEFLNQNLIFQENLLKSALHLLKNEGVLVYSVCSLYPEEAEFQMLKFRDQLEPLNLPKWLSSSYIMGGKTIQGTGRLFPTLQNTLGFFIAKFKKRGI
ncbi:MAG: RsmB/NOP family class I SAM-dependent RNA methyltransferase [Promethearchaeia archaeon]